MTDIDLVTKNVREYDFRHISDATGDELEYMYWVYEHTSSFDTHRGFRLSKMRYKLEREDAADHTTFEPFPDVGHFLIDPLLFQFPDPSPADIRDEL